MSYQLVTSAVDETEACFISSPSFLTTILVRFLSESPVGEWNQYEITVDHPDFTVALNGAVVNRFHFTGDPQSPQRGLFSTAAQPRFIGLQTHTGTVLYPRIERREL